MMDQGMKARIITAIQCTYEAVAGDLQTACAEMGDEMDLRDAVECTIDADRVRSFGGDEEAAEALYSLGSWEKMKRLGDEALREYF